MREERKEANSNLNKAETAILKSLLTENGFIKKAYGSYYRIMEHDLRQTIHIQKYSWDTKFTINISIEQLYQRPLFDHLSSIIIFRQAVLYTDAYKKENNISKGTIDYWFDFSDVNRTNDSMQKVRTEFEKMIIPFLDSVNTNKLLADFVFERTSTQKPYFIQPDSTWSNFYASLLALRIEDHNHSIYFLDRTIVNAKKNDRIWAQEVLQEVNKLREMLESDKNLIREYFQKNTNDNRIQFKIKE